MKTLFLMISLFTIGCFGSEQPVALIKKPSLSLDGKYFKIPTAIKDLLAAKTIEEKDLHELASFLQEKHQELNPVEAIDGNGISLLMYAAESKHKAARQLIYDHKPDINRFCKGQTALFRAAMSTNAQSIDVMQELIQQRADIKVTWGETTLQEHVNSVLQTQYAIMAHHTSSSGSHYNEEKESKETVAKLIGLFKAKKNLLDQSSSNQ